MTAPLAYVRHVAEETSSRSLAGSQSSELARLTLELVRELEASRQAGDQLRAVLDDLIRWARRGAAYRSGATLEHTGEVEAKISQAVRLLGAIRSPDEAVRP